MIETDPSEHAEQKVPKNASSALRASPTQLWSQKGRARAPGVQGREPPRWWLSRTGSKNKADLMWGPRHAIHARVERCCEDWSPLVLRSLFPDHHLQTASMPRMSATSTSVIQQPDFVADSIMIFTLRSKEHDAIRWPNFGCAQATCHTCKCRRGHREQTLRK